MSAGPSYPVRVEGRLDPGLSRWMWLVKWLLAIPHYIVLAFLWVAFFLLSIVALVAIVATGRYPRAIFDFNVGVLRWTWRVSFYALGALGTDRYPPFTLAEATDYPASLDVRYPERLSRGLALVKWWLLAIPHYLVVGMLTGGGTWVAWQGDRWSLAWGGGLIGLLVVIAVVALLFTGRYPRGIFDFVLGLDRWVLRVTGYAALMTDEYPPFRLDQGETEETAVAREIDEAAPTAESGLPAVAAPGAKTAWSGGRIALLAVGSLVGLVSLGVLAGGIASLVIDKTQRDDGFVTTPTEVFATPTYALVSETAEIEGPDWAWRDLVGTVRIHARTDSPIFLGIGPASDVEGYLAGVGHDKVEDYRDDPDEYERRPGGAPDAAPGEQGFWAASAEGQGEVNLDWDPTDGLWTLVVMNADGSRFVDATLSAGAELDALRWLGWALIGAGALLALLAGALIYGSLPKRRG